MKTLIFKKNILAVAVGLAISGFLIFNTINTARISIPGKSSDSISEEAKAAGATTDWLSQVMKNIQTKELEASQDESGNWLDMDSGI